MKNTQTHHILRNALLALLLSVSCASTLRADERIQNGGFETGTFAPWVASDPNNPAFINIGGDPAFAHSGNFHANLGSTPLTGTLTQTFSTVANAIYTITFWLANDGTPNPAGGSLNSFVTSFNGVPIAALSLAANAASFGYTRFSAMVTATGPSSTLQFRFRNDDDFFRLDDVSVAPDQGSTFWLALPAFGALVLSQRLSRKVRSATA